MGQDINTEFMNILPKPVEGGSVPEVETESGTLAPIRDQLTPSQVSTTIAKTPPIDAPELPVPTPKAIHTSAVKSELTDESKKNQWITNPSYMGAFLSKFWDLLILLQNTRFNESQMKQVVEQALFELGMENAELAKTLKDLAANEEFMRAIGSFLSVAGSLYQLKTMVSARGEITTKVNASELGQRVSAKERDIKALDPIMNIDLSNRQAVSDAVRNAPAAIKPQIETELARLDSMKKAVRKEVYTELDQASTRQRIVSEMLRQATEGFVSIVISTYKHQEGKEEKLKGIIEALIQMFNKVNDGINKAKDDLKTQFEQILRQIIEASSENTKSHLIGRS